jgi:hypothetical protein
MNVTPWLRAELLDDLDQIAHLGLSTDRRRAAKVDEAVAVQVRDNAQLALEASRNTSFQSSGVSFCRATAVRVRCP